MKKIDGVEALKEMLKIEKIKFEMEEKINNLNLFTQEIEINYDYSICDIVRKLLNEPEDTDIPFDADGEEILKITSSPDYVCNDWIINGIFDYFENKMTLDELINYLLEEE